MAISLNKNIKVKNKKSFEKTNHKILTLLKKENGASQLLEFVKNIKDVKEQEYVFNKLVDLPMGVSFMEKLIRRVNIAEYEFASIYKLLYSKQTPTAKMSFSVVRPLLAIQDIKLNTKLIKSVIRLPPRIRKQHLQSFLTWHLLHNKHINITFDGFKVCEVYSILQVILSSGMQLTVASSRDLSVVGVEHNDPRILWYVSQQIPERKIVECYIKSLIIHCGEYKPYALVNLFNTLENNIPKPYSIVSKRSIVKDNIDSTFSEKRISIRYTKVMEYKIPIRLLLSYKKLIVYLEKQQGSDIHIRTEKPILWRVTDVPVNIKDDSISRKISNLLLEILNSPMTEVEKNSLILSLISNQNTKDKVKKFFSNSWHPLCRTITKQRNNKVQK